MPAARCDRPLEPSEKEPSHPDPPAPNTVGTATHPARTPSGDARPRLHERLFRVPVAAPGSPVGTCAWRTAPSSSAPSTRSTRLTARLARLDDRGLRNIRMSDLAASLRAIQHVPVRRHKHPRARPAHLLSELGSIRRRPTRHRTHHMPTTRRDKPLPTPCARPRREDPTHPTIVRRCTDRPLGLSTTERQPKFLSWPVPVDPLPSPSWGAGCWCGAGGRVPESGVGSRSTCACTLRTPCSHASLT